MFVFPFVFSSDCGGGGGRTEFELHGVVGCEPGVWVVLEHGRCCYCYCYCSCIVQHVQYVQYMYVLRTGRTGVVLRSPQMQQRGRFPRFCPTLQDAVDRSRNELWDVLMADGSVVTLESWVVICKARHALKTG